MEKNNTNKFKLLKLPSFFTSSCKTQNLSQVIDHNKNPIFSQPPLSEKVLDNVEEKYPFHKLSIKPKNINNNKKNNSNSPYYSSSSLIKSSPLSSSSLMMCKPRCPPASPASALFTKQETKQGNKKMTKTKKKKKINKDFRNNNYYGIKNRLKSNSFTFSSSNGTDDNAADWFSSDDEREYDDEKQTMFSLKSVSFSSKSESAEEAEVRLGEITRAWDLHASSDFAGKSVWKELLWRPTPSTRRILLAAIGINFFMQASGNDAVIYYLPEVFKAAGIHNKKQLFAINVVMGTAKASFVMISALFLDKFGRRPLLLLGTIGMSVSLLVLGLGSKFLEHENNRPTWAIVMSVIAVCADVSFFSIGLGPITWVYSSEVFPLRLRAQGTSVAVSVNRVVSGVVSMTFLSVTKKLSFGGMFFVLSGIMVLATVFFFFVLPETKGKSLEEIGKLFEDKKTSDDNREIS